MVVVPKISGKCAELLQAFKNRVETYKRRAKQRELAQQSGESLLRLHRLWNLEMESWNAVMTAWVPLKACVDAHGGDPNLILLPDPPPPEPTEPGLPDSGNEQNPPEGSEGSGSSATPEDSERRQVHRCGAKCKTVDHLCSRKTSNDQYCYQHA